jgi:dTDP-4-amino-4,6-dideoxygalactose transaminase
VLAGARPVFSDIRPDTLNIDETKLERLITPRTKAIAVVHYAGVACEMDTILQLAKRHDIAVIEDNAHGLFAKYKDRYLGTLGCLATQSFHETKNFTCGEGGALLINDPKYVERAEIIREKGTDRSKFFRGQVDKYTWMDVGSSYLPSDILAAFLYAQLEARDDIQARRQRIWEYYDEHLREWAKNSNVQLPFVPAHCEQSFHMYYLLLPTAEKRNRLLEYLNAADINSVFHYVPLHLSRMGRMFGGEDGQCPVTEDISERLLRLPFYTGLSEADQSRVVSALKDFTSQKH